MSEAVDRFPTPDSESDPERKAIRAAMIRLLGGAPLHVDTEANLTVVNLAKEAQVKRGALTHRHTDLQDEFRARVQAQADDGKSQREVELEGELSEALDLLASMTEDRNSWRDASKDFVRIIQTLEVEKTRLQSQVDALKKRLDRQGASVSAISKKS